MAMADVAAPLSDPTPWINLGATGLFILAFMTGRFYAQGTVTKIENERDKAVLAAELREKRLVDERDRALSERDEMVDVIKDFTHTASAILNITATPWKRPPPPKTPRRGGES